MRELTEVIGIDRRIVERWRKWWRDSFTTTPVWHVARAAFMPPVDPDWLKAAGRACGALRRRPSAARHRQIVPMLDDPGSARRVAHWTA
jgi:hypothetical protein